MGTVSNEINKTAIEISEKREKRVKPSEWNFVSTSSGKDYGNNSKYPELELATFLNDFFVYGESQQALKFIKNFTEGCLKATLQP